MQMRRWGEAGRRHDLKQREAAVRVVAARFDGHQIAKEPERLTFVGLERVAKSVDRHRFLLALACAVTRRSDPVAHRCQVPTASRSRTAKSGEGSMKMR